MVCTCKRVYKQSQRTEGSQLDYLQARCVNYNTRANWLEAALCCTIYISYDPSFSCARAAKLNGASWFYYVGRNMWIGCIYRALSQFYLSLQALYNTRQHSPIQTIIHTLMANATMHTHILIEKPKDTQTCSLQKPGTEPLTFPISNHSTYWATSSPYKYIHTLTTYGITVMFLHVCLMHGT